MKESLADFIHNGGKLNSWGEVELFRKFNNGKLPTYWNTLYRKKLYLRGNQNGSKNISNNIQ